MNDDNRWPGDSRHAKTKTNLLISSFTSPSNQYHCISFGTPSFAEYIRLVMPSLHLPSQPSSDDDDEHDVCNDNGASSTPPIASSSPSPSMPIDATAPLVPVTECHFFEKFKMSLFSDNITAEPVIKVEPLSWLDTGYGGMNWPMQQ
jgi:hypothetical protein